jgi:hypothetical protein
MKRLVLGVLLCFWGGISVAGESGIYDDLGKRILRLGLDSLILHGVCSNDNNCRVGDYIFYDRSEDGVGFYFYGISDRQIVRGLVRDIVGGMDFHKCGDVRITFFSAGFEVVRSSFFKPEPVAEFFILGGAECTR